MLSAARMAQMSRLLDEVLELDAEGRQRWLMALSPEYRDLEPALRQALLDEPGATSGPDPLLTLPKIRVAGGKLELASDPQPGTRVGPYLLVRPLGSGGMAEVWLAQRADGAFKREVALKLPMVSRLREDLASRFARERDILAGLEHPNIARLYDAGVSTEGLPYLAMEYVRGEPVTAWCDAQRIGVRERLKLFLQVLDAVQYAHAHHVIHRDIKPSNILVTQAGQVRLLDFGVAKLLEHEDTQADLTQMYGRALTPEYASPELVRGDEIGECADVYSLGVVLFELLSGNRPYQLKARASAALLEQAIATAQVERPSTRLGVEAAGVRGTTQQELARHLKGDLDAIVLKALAKEPEDRYPGAAAMADDLQRYLNGKPIAARPPRLAYRFSKFVLRHRVGFAGAVAATLLIVAAVGYVLTHPPVGGALTAKAAGATALADARSIAVLPFVDMSEKHDQEYFSDGLSEELINQLARSPELKVIARTSSFQFKGKNEDVRTIALQLGVANLLEGSVRKAGPELRITAQLIRASDGSHLWSQTYDRSLVDIFKVQDEIAGTVAEALHATFVNGETAGNRYPDVDAYNLVLEGNYFKARVTGRDVDKAVQLYRKAIDIKPDYALAWARLASAYLIQAVSKGTPSPADNKKVLDALNRAIQLDPQLIWAYYTRAGFNMNVTWDWAAVRADNERMRQIEPTNSYLVPAALGEFALAFGRVDRAAELYQTVVERNPLDSYALDAYGLILCAANRLHECLQRRLRLLQLHPEFGHVNSAVGLARLYLGQLDEALEAMRQEPEEDCRLAGLALVYAAMGRRADSDAALTALSEKFSRSQPFRIAQVHAYRGEIDSAFNWLDRAVQQHDVDVPYLKSDPLLRKLHKDPRFQSLLIRLKLDGEEGDLN
jgi:eukaryotic-like serine/threonine-protein kinase